MVYKRGRFVVHYKDGQTYIEDRKNPRAWDDRPRKPTTALGIQPDTNILANLFVKNYKTGKEHRSEIVIDFTSKVPNERIALNEMVLKGSWKFNYQFFMDKSADVKGGRKDVWNLRLGMVVDRLGHCVCVEYVGTGVPRVYYTTVQSLGMDAISLKVNYGINLEELPDPKDNFAPYPEINPARLLERAERERALLEPEEPKLLDG